MRAWTQAEVGVSRHPGLPELGLLLGPALSQSTRGPPSWPLAGA